MPFLAKAHSPIPTQDILSWQFDDPQYDLDQPIYNDAVDPTRFITGRQGKALIRQLAAGFRKHGLRKGDCVVIGSFNNLFYPVLALGILAAGGIYTGTNPAYTSFEVAHQVNTVHAKFIICEPDILSTILEAKHDVPKSRIFIFDHDGQRVPDGFESYKALLEHGEADWPRFDDAETSKNTTAMLLFSSGTTGLPKAVQLSHYNLIAQDTLVREVRPQTAETQRLVALPIFHAATTPSCVIAPFKGGEKRYICKRFELESFLKYMEKYKVPELVLVPPLAIAILMSPLTKKYSLEHIQWAACGAAPLDKDVQARFKILLPPGTPFTQGYGMTEASCLISTVAPPEHDDSGSVGRMINNLDVKVIDEDGNDISDYDVRGEICLRGPTITRGYFEDEEANKRDFDDEGYFHTGDVGYLSKETGFWYIVDRRKELIKVRSFQVAPAELEAVLLSHPSIVDAAVIGIPASQNSTSGELPRAYVVQRDDSTTLTEDEVVNYSAERLVGYKRLEGGVKFVDAIPKTPSGKILKKKLREWARRERGAKL
ncbi:hypothetical protein BDV96DRAFT_594164 [Lophiotrema nucula]|uniref:AMP-binding enzyme n=1 Tax=Lophiotrema nucula TaxID=690887 RepID=A0A6A5ZSP0_9PLEO|nr:hypothetical protein BDV96DRAFT_594164 [Lophiotrema nucula]